MREVLHPALKSRRDALRAAGICINSSFHPTPRARVEHGPVVKAGKCQHCCDTHDAGRKERTPMTVACPQCFAPPKQPCRAMNGAGRATNFHRSRREAAQRAKESSS